jgi:monothiol glutaredoxin
MADQALVKKVEDMVKSNKVFIFMKGTPQFPQCGFSARACQVLKAAGVKEVKGFDVLSDDPLWDALEAYTQWPTVPQVFINGEFIGGCDIVTEMYERGELQKLLA